MKELDFERITLSITGMRTSTREYELLKTDTGLQATMYDGPWLYNDDIKREDCQLSQGIGTDRDYRKVAEILSGLGIEKWNGFSGSDPNILDGESFSLTIILSDGRTVEARGCNSYPKNYKEFFECLDEAVNGPKEY